MTIEARVARLDRARARTRARLQASGFERTVAEALGEGAGAPGLALEAARSADALEKLLADQQPVYAELAKQIDWIAANWFDPALMRWTARHIRSLRSMTAEDFIALKAETTALSELLPDLMTSIVRRQELQACVRANSDPDLPAIAAAITCDADRASRVTCRDSVFVGGAHPLAVLQPLDSSSMSDDELSALGPDAASWLAFAGLTAGSGAAPERVYVDGLPAPGGAPASAIGRVSVNGDPFTVEYAGAGETRIDIDLRTPDRRWRIDLSSPSLGAGGGSPLGPTGAPTSRSSAFGVSGAVPGLPITFSLHASHRFDARRPLFVAPDSGALSVPTGDLRTTSEGSDMAATAAFTTARLILRTVVSDTRMHADHAGVGGTNGPTTGQRIDTRSMSARTSWRIADGSRVHRGGFSLNQDRLDAAADSLAPFLVVTGQFATGGDEVAHAERRVTAWTVKHVVDGQEGRWKAGIEGGRSVLDDARVPNPLGRLQRSTPDAGTATWIVSRGVFDARARTASAAVFAERVIGDASRRTVRAGLRIDWQNGAGVMLSPRVGAAMRLGRFRLSGGAGLFVQPWSPDLFAAIAIAGRAGASTFVMHGVAPDSIETLDPHGGERLHAVIASAFERRRDFVLRAGAQRTVGPFETGLEHTWTHASSLAGTVRARQAGDLVDIISSDRRLRRHQTHARASVRRGTNAVVAHYQHAWSFDDSEGPRALPARQGDVAGEWARSAGVPRHAFGLTALLRLPWQIRTSLAAEARSGLPYSIVTGHDSDGLAAFSDRAGLPRNAGTLPVSGKISMSASRLVRMPRLRWLAFDVGLRADNLTGHRNVTSVGHVLESPMFGVPLGAAPGRSIRFWVALAR